MFLSIMLAFNVFAAAPCNGAQVGQWTNPDGSRGGWLAKTAQVEKQVFVGPEAQICDEAQVRGSSRVFGRAKVSGKSVVRNAIICQASQISGFDVVDSDYYCQTEDPEPPHPGEAGNKTLLGIDSDRDGVRDDVEIWINDRYSNTPTKNQQELRLLFKQLALSFQYRIKFQNNSSKLTEGNSIEALITNCIGLTIVDGSSSKHGAQLESVFFNTKDRMHAYLASQKYAPESFIIENNKSKVCAFSKQKVKQLK